MKFGQASSVLCLRDFDKVALPVNLGDRVGRNLMGSLSPPGSPAGSKIRLPGFYRKATVSSGRASEHIVHQISHDLPLTYAEQRQRAFSAQSHTGFAQPFHEFVGCEDCAETCHALKERELILERNRTRRLAEIMTTAPEPLRKLTRADTKYSGNSCGRQAAISTSLVLGCSSHRRQVV